MMETETRTPPSRYKSVRRRPQPPSNVQVPPLPVPRNAPAVPVPRPQARAATFSADRVPQRVEERPAMQSSRAEPEHHSGARFRRLLKLNTKETPPPPPRSSQPVTAPPISHSEQSMGRKISKSRKMNTEEHASGNAPRGLMATMDQVALDGKSHKSQNTATSKVTSAAESGPICDLKIPITYTKGSPSSVDVPSNANAEAVLDQLRPGHERYLYECWPNMGLQRQVRYFELASDVKNTWDEGSPNFFRVAKGVWGESNQRLEDFPKHEPGTGEVFFFYYVHSEKKWQKRSMTLDGGAIKIIKTGRPHDKDYLQSITLEYFDIYTFFDPMSPSSKIKCPTNFCFALKSQHKPSIFGKNAVFVHYFAFDAEPYFEKQYRLIRDRKSRLIAEKKSLSWWDGSTDTKPESTVGSKATDESSADASSRSKHPKPLLSQEELGRTHSTSSSDALQRSKSLSRNKSIKRSNTTKDRSVSATAPKSRGLVGSTEQEVFSAGGLLGQDYEEKKRHALFAFKDLRAAPPIPALPHASPKMDDMRPVTRHNTAPNSSGTLLTFGADEPIANIPHHNKRGRGITVSSQELAEQGGLVSLANCSAIASDDAPGSKPTPTLRSRQFAEESAFTGQGLLAGTREGFGAAKRGHGVGCMVDAIGKNGEIKPLMDVRQDSMFAQGSLLQQRERELGAAGPKIHRGKDKDKDDSSDDEPWK